MAWLQYEYLRESCGKRFRSSDQEAVGTGFDHLPFGGHEYSLDGLQKKKIFCNAG